MTFALDDHWVWDFWIADDGALFHLYYLHAPTSLGDPHLRHRNARIGHATSIDLRTWTNCGVVLEPGEPGTFDETATWTGSVVQGPDGVWRMFYTGAQFLSTDSFVNVQSIGVATSTDLHTWSKSPDPVTCADPRWYETLADPSCPQESWRDPWVFADPDGDGWHMLITARASTGDEADRGVIGHCTSPDLKTWHAQPPLSDPGVGFTHLEVPQVSTIDGRTVLLFSCDSPALAGIRAMGGQMGGIWAVETASPIGPYDIAASTLLAAEALYSGRILQDRSGDWVLLAFENTAVDGEFVGTLSDPLAVGWSAPGGPIALTRRSAEAS